MKRAIVASLVTVLGLTAVTACDPSEVNTKPDKSAVKGGAQADEAKIGQAVTIEGNDDGSKIQVTALKVTDTKSTDQFSKADKGMRLVAVQFRLVNTGSAPYDDAPSNGAKVIDSKGQQYESDIFFQSIAAGQMLPASVKLAKSNQALGYLTFQVPVKAKITQVQFSMDSGFGDTAQWSVH